MFTVTLLLISFRLILSYNCCQAAATAADEHHEARFLPKPKAQNHLSIRLLVWITLEHKRCHLSQHEGRKVLKEGKTNIFLILQTLNRKLSNSFMYTTENHQK
jgi:hypothetical protein